MEKPNIKRIEPTNFDGYPAHYPYAPYRDFADDEEINILHYWRVLMKHKWKIVLITFLGFAMGVGASYIMPKKYKTEVTLMPLTASGTGGLSGIANQLSSIPLVGSQLGAMGGLAGGKSKELINILKSRTIAENTIRKFDLMKLLFADRWDSQAQAFRPNWLGKVPVMEDAVMIFRKKISTIAEDKKTGLIKVEIKLGNSELAAKIANSMIMSLQDFLEENSFTISKRNRLFIEQQLVKNASKLLEAGKELNNFYAQNKISSVVPQLDVNVGAYQIVPKPFEDFQKDLESIEKEQEILNQKKESAVVQRVPGQIYLQYLILNRELISKAHALLTQQYEMAKIEESKEDLAFQVIDKAEVKIRPNSPKKIMNAAIGLMSGFFLAVFVAFFLEYIRQLKAKESQR